MFIYTVGRKRCKWDNCISNYLIQRILLASSTIREQLPFLLLLCALSTSFHSSEASAPLLSGRRDQPPPLIVDQPQNLIQVLVVAVSFKVVARVFDDPVSFLITLSVDDAYIELNITGGAGIVEIDDWLMYDIALDESRVRDFAFACEYSRLSVAHVVLRYTQPCAYFLSEIFVK